MPADQPGTSDRPEETAKVERRAIEQRDSTDHPLNQGQFEGRNTEWVDEVLTEASDKWIRENKDQRPWLSDAADAPPSTRRAYLELDTNESHVLPRHSSYGDTELHVRRLTRLEDPAQTEPDHYARGVDGVHGNRHYCGTMHTRVTDPDVLATTWNNAKQHADIKPILDMPLDIQRKTPQAEVAIEDVMGPGGHTYCAGWRLAGDRDEAKDDRKAWAQARRDWLAEHGTLDGFTDEPPSAEQIPSFKGGTIQLLFKPHSSGEGYTLNTFYPKPLDRDQPETTDHADN